MFLLGSVLCSKSLHELHTSLVLPAFQARCDNSPASALKTFRLAYSESCRMCPITSYGQPSGVDFLDDF